MPSKEDVLLWHQNCRNCPHTITLPHTDEMTPQNGIRIRCAECNTTNHVVNQEKREVVA